MELGQERHIDELVKKFNLVGHKPVYSPMDSKINLEPSTNSNCTLPYRELLGALLWITRCTRPDIYYSVVYLSKFASSYDESHYKALTRVLKYISTTRNLRLAFDKVTPDGISASDVYEVGLEWFSDSDWAGDASDRKSVSGAIGFLCGSPISWLSKKQHTVALSSCEAEYYAITEATKDILHAEQMIGEIVPVKQPVDLFIDNQGAGYMSQNAVNNKRTKHIDIRYRFVQHFIKNVRVE